LFLSASNIILLSFFTGGFYKETALGGILG